MGPKKLLQPGDGRLSHRGHRTAGRGWPGGMLPYLIALAVIALAVVIRLAVDDATDDVRPTYLFFFPFVAVAAFFGFRAGLFAAVLAAAAVVFIAAHRIEVHEAFYTAAFLAEAAFIAWLVSGLRNTSQQIREHSARLEEERLRLTLAQTAGRMGTWDLDVASGQLRWADGMEALHGLPPGAAPADKESFLKLVHPDDREAVAQRSSQALKLRSHSDEYRIVTPGGAVRWIASRGRTYFDRTGNPVRMLGVSVDITERKLIEETVRSSEERFRNMANAAPVLIWLSDAQGLGTFFNDVWLEFTGRKLEQEAGHGWKEAVHPDDIAAGTVPPSDAVRAHEPFEAEFRLRHHSGVYRWVLARATPLNNPDGSFAGYIGSAIDITERRAAAEALTFLSDASAELAGASQYLERIQALAGLSVRNFADWCTVTLLDDDGDLQRVAAAHRDLEKLPAIEALAVGSRPRLAFADVISAAIETGVPQFDRVLTTESLEARAQGKQQLRRMLDTAVASSICIPLIARDRTLGAVMFARTSASPPYDDSDVRLGEDLVSRASNLIDNARLLAEGQATATRLAQVNESLAFLADAGSELAQALGLDDTLDNLSSLLVPRFADWCTVTLIPEGGQPINRISHREPAKVAAIERAYALGGRGFPHQAGVAIDTGRPVIHYEITDELLREISVSERHYQAMLALQDISGIAVPLRARGRTTGAIMCVRSAGSRHYDEDDLHLLEDLARRAATALDNARLYDEVETTAEKVSVANHSLQFLTDAAGILASTMHVDAALTDIAKLTSGRIADWCIIDLAEEDGFTRRAAAVGAHPNAAELAAKLLPAGPLDRSSPGVRALGRGEPLFIPDITRELPFPLRAEPERLAMIRNIGIRSVMIVPIRARGRTFGAISLATATSSRVYTQHDLDVANQLARRIGLFLDNARLYELSQATEAELRKAIEVKDEFLAMMSHELRTPLTIISGGSRLLRSRGRAMDDDTREEVLKDIDEETDRLLGMVENLLTMARVELASDVAIEPVLLGRFVQGVIASFQNRRPNRPINVITGNDEIVVLAAPTLLEQIVRNLLGNADKYSPQGLPIDITISAREPSEARLQVMDRGVGVEEDELTLIFDRFYRSTKTSRHTSGTGLGLALCKRLVTAMSGDIWAASREGGGLELSITLPLYTDETEMALEPAIAVED